MAPQKGYGRRIEPIENRTLLEAELNEEEQKCLQLAMDGCTKDKESVAAAVRILIHRQQLQPKVYSYDFEEIRDISNCSVSILRKYLTKFNNILHKRLIDANEGALMDCTDSLGTRRSEARLRNYDETTENENSDDGEDDDNSFEKQNGNDSSDIINGESLIEPKEEKKSPGPEKQNPDLDDEEPASENDDKNSYIKDPDFEEDCEPEDGDDESGSVSRKNVTLFNALNNSHTSPDERPSPVVKKERRPHDVDQVPAEVCCVLNGEDVSDLVWFVCFGGSRYRSLSERIPLAVAVGRILMRQETAAEACIRTGIPQGTITNYERRAEVAIFKRNNGKMHQNVNTSASIRAPPVSLIGEAKVLKEMKNAQALKRPLHMDDMVNGKRSRSQDPEDEIIYEVFNPEDVERELENARVAYELSTNMCAAIRSTLLESGSIKQAAARFMVLPNPLTIWRNMLVKVLKGEEPALCKVTDLPTPVRVYNPGLQLATPLQSGFRIPKKEKNDGEDKRDSSSSYKYKSGNSGSRTRRDSDRERDSGRDRDDRRRRDKDREREKDQKDKYKRRSYDKKEPKKEVPSDDESIEEEVSWSEEALDKIRTDIENMVNFAGVPCAYFILPDAIMDVVISKKSISEVSDSRRIPPIMLKTYVQMSLTVLKAKEY